MIRKPLFSWQDGEAICVLNDGKKVFYGAASCHPNDEDMMNEKTGCEIAMRRAELKYYRYCRDNLKERLAALKQLYYTMNRSKYFNENSYENKMLQRQIRMIELDLATVREMIADGEQSLRTYIAEKDKFYNKIRKNRKFEAANNEQSNS